MQLMDDHSMTPMNRIILSVRNMVELLPRAVTEEGPREVEWITRTLQGMLGTMLENLEEEVMFRWSSAMTQRKRQRAPTHLSISSVDPRSVIEWAVVRPSIRRRIASSSKRISCAWRCLPRKRSTVTIYIISLDSFVSDKRQRFP